VDTKIFKEWIPGYSWSGNLDIQGVLTPGYFKEWKLGKIKEWILGNSWRKYQEIQGVDQRKFKE